MGKGKSKVVLMRVSNGAKVGLRYAKLFLRWFQGGS